ncbi:hypothetical protein [Agrobacterium pusense]|uniref:hypothetical protein n=1 Tax=Agrobacterium pusense TaxID=648995 RepID=UPI0022B88547|nr:hypothetical protein [Agrobacterium pusense]MCZ7926176.1 hypothetical protein [Agrobacterium pusense]
MSWIYPADIEPTDYAGFVYRITNLVTGQMYIGRKYLWSKSKGKKAVQSKWQAYWGSSKELAADIKELGQDNFRREILAFYPTRAATNYAEVAYQMKLDVLTAKLEDGSFAYYNRNILARYFHKTAVDYAAGMVVRDVTGV